MITITRGANHARLSAAKNAAWNPDPEEIAELSARVYERLRKRAQRAQTSNFAYHGGYWNGYKDGLKDGLQGFLNTLT